MSSPEGLAVDAAGSLYVADRARQCVRKVTGSTVSRVAGGGASTACSYAGAAGSVSLSGPSAVAATPSGAVLVSDSGRNCIRRVSGGTVTPWVGTGTAGSAGDGGPAVGATLRDPGGIAVRPDGDLLFADTGNSEVRYVVGGAN
jgi:sugar lactone lactonase YvrE